MGQVEKMTRELVAEHLDALAEESGMDKDGPRFTMAVLAGMLETYNELIEHRASTDEEAQDYLNASLIILGKLD